MYVTRHGQVLTSEPSPGALVYKGFPSLEERPAPSSIPIHPGLELFEDQENEDGAGRSETA